MSKPKHAVGDVVEFKSGLPPRGWCRGVVRLVQPKSPFGPGVWYACETEGFAESKEGCAAWVQARHIRPSEIRHCRVAVVNEDGNMAGCSHEVDPGWLDQHRCVEHRRQWLGLQVAP